MKYIIKLVAAIALLAFASTARAESDAYSIGHAENGYLAVEIRPYNSIYLNGKVSIYEGVHLVAEADLSGVTTVASGVTYSGSDGFYSFYGVPSGDYTATFSVTGGSSIGYYLYNYSGNYIHWAGDYGDEADASFYLN